MSAILRIEQVGIPGGAGFDGKARTDGLADGALVTISSVGAGTTHTFRLLWVPSLDTDAVSTFVAGATSATFNPTASVYGTYRIELDVDGELTVHTFTIRTPRLGLVIPAFNEDADANASLFLNGPAQIAASENNEDYALNPSINYAGWWPAFEDFMLKMDSEFGDVQPLDTGPTTKAVAAGDYREADTSGGAVTYDLPAAPTKGQTAEFVHFTGGNNMIINGNGNNIGGSATKTSAIAKEYIRVVFGNTEWNLST